MWPEDEMDRPRSRPDADLPTDTDLEALESELAAAGARARRGSPGAVTPTFAAALRVRLLSAYGSAGTLPAAGIADTTIGLPPSGPAELPATPHADGSVESHGSSSTRAHGLDALRSGRLATEPTVIAPTRLNGRTSVRTPTVLPAPRWTVLAAAAALILAVVGLSGSLLPPVRADSRVVAATAAELVRDAATTRLGADALLQAGDEIRVGPGGFAELLLGDSRVRLDAGADLRLSALDRTRIDIDQLAGRAWHRVVLPSGGRYAVTTGDLTWTAQGTAFDLDRTGPTAPGGDVVHELSIQHAVVVDGPGLRLTVDEAHGASVWLGGVPTVATAAVSAAVAVTDPWVGLNARLDAAGGLPLGSLEGLDFAAATLGPTASASPAVPTSFETADPTELETPAPTPEPTPAATPEPTPRPTPKPTPKPSPTPTPTFGTMSLSAFACPGGVVLGWSVPELAAFDHVQILRGTSAEIPTVYPPSGGVVAIDGGYTTNPAVTGGDDPLADGGTYWYRAVAFDAANVAIAASSAKGATAPPIAGLGSLATTPGAPGSGAMTFDWTPFTGSGDCFSFYKLVASVDNPTPGYLQGSQALAVFESPTVATTTVTDGLASGTTYYFRLQALRVTSLGKFVVAQTAVTQATVP